MIPTPLPRRRTGGVPGLPSLDDLLARLQVRTAGAEAPTGVGTLPTGFGPPEMGLESLVAPYEAPTGYGGFGYGLGGFDPLEGFGSDTTGSAGFPGLPGGGGTTAPVGGYTGAGGGVVPYTGPPPKGIQDWEDSTSNGRIPAHLMEMVPSGSGGRQPMMPLAGRAYMDMRAAAADDGVDLVFGQSYRTYPEQVSLAQQKGIYGQGGLAAVPGTSNHGEGLALDMDLSADPRMLSWLTNNANDFGFYTIPGESWHWQHEGGYRPEFRFNGGGGRGSGGAEPSPAPSRGSSSSSGNPRQSSTPSPRPRRRRKHAAEPDYGGVISY